MPAHDLTSGHRVGAVGPSQHSRDRCYGIPLSNGMVLRIRAGKRPDAQTSALLVEMFTAAHRRLAATQLAGHGEGDSATDSTGGS
jgi:hypothetical protein